MGWSWAGRILASVTDKFLVIFVFFPLAIFHWRGTWHLQDVYLFPDDEVLSSWVSLAIGSAAGVVLPLIHHHWVKCLQARPRWVYAIGIRVYMYICGWAVLCFWRGSWNLVDHYLSEGWLNSLIIYAVAHILSLFFRTSRTNAGLPISIQIDISADMDRPDTRYAIKASETCKFLLDICFTQFVVVTINVLVWRGIWNVLDAFFYPQDLFVSDVASIGWGYITVILLYIMEYPMSLASAKLDNHHIGFKLAYEGIIIAVSTWALILVWRGAWDLCRDYIIPDRRVGGWVCHTVGVAGLMLLQGFSNVATNGIDIDGSYSQGEGIFPLQYLRYYFQDKAKVQPSDGKYSELQSLVVEDQDEAEMKDGETGTAGSDGEYYADSELSSESLEDSAPLTGTRTKKKKKQTDKPHQNGTIL